MSKLYEVELNSKGAPNFSTAREVPERKKGKWINEKWTDDDQLIGVTCSNCHVVESRFYTYCPNCGADMKGEQDE